MHVYAIAPVARYEPESVITKSIECLKTLEHDNFTLDIYYVIDTFPGDNRKLQFTLPNNFKMILRNTNRGHRAGAINDILKEIKNPDYVALFDVEHRPARDYIVKCVAALEENDAAVSSGCWHFMINKTSILTKMIALEHTFMDDLYRLLSHFEGFMAIQGTGVIKGSFLKDESLNEETSLDDVDLTTRMCLKARAAVLADTTMGD
jgi:cellulose synthase/poly-beta-1,6-N-acetylglucosamine synthase-like glycosyltransferase